MDSWMIQGSVDGEHWVTMATVTGFEGLNARNVVRSFPISNPVERRIVRLFQTPPTRNNNNIILSAVEFFGTLKE
jgi:hypothetical protein